MVQLPHHRDPSDRSWTGRENGDIRDDNELRLKLIWCKPGRFPRGSLVGDKNEQPVREITLTQGFWLSETEVTQEQWAQVMKTQPWKDRGGVPAGADYPATCVSWEDAIEFCRLLTESEHETGRLPADLHYTLPTEAQWEYACRAGTVTEYSFGDNADGLGDYGWSRTSFVFITADEQYPRQVAMKRPNPWGFFDMHGGVLEHCLDWYGEDYYERSPLEDPVGPSTGSYRIIRGGSWNDLASDCRSACRSACGPGDRSDILGFRVVCGSAHRERNVS